ncbi:MAG: ABC transporter permease subunit [Candidatus Latescibacteria bacterium]|nr:ABC transporter permease subunit [Candidatus Latescibacterota bacterium]
MRNALAVYVREIKSYFVSPILYIIATVFMLVVGNSFKDYFIRFAMMTMQALRQATNSGGEVPLFNINSYVATNMFAFMNYMFLLIVPLLTMRLYAEEKKTGTMELLMTSPITTTQVLIGKFFSCLTIYFFMMSLTIAFVVIMMIQSNGKLDWGPIFSSYLGTFLLGSAIISIGMFFSSLTENQIIAAAVSLSIIMGLWLLIHSARYITPPYNDLISYFSLSDHLDSFTYGFIGINHIVYFISMTVFWLVLTGINVESTRWRQ